MSAPTRAPMMPPNSAVVRGAPGGVCCPQFTDRLAVLEQLTVQRRPARAGPGLRRREVEQALHAAQEQRLGRQSQPPHLGGALAGAVAIALAGAVGSALADGVAPMLAAVEATPLTGAVVLAPVLARLQAHQLLG